uniref:Uncharacterized protein n=1 Tax=Kalanchoe fedtschenkoi TaxID=63787 RepID=A0A7N0VBZ9_KALFE
MYELQFAVPMAGAVITSVNTRLDARTVSVLLKHSGSKLLFVDYAMFGFGAVLVCPHKLAELESFAT